MSSIKFIDVISRVKELKGLHHDHEVAVLLGLSKTAFSERKRRNSLPAKEIELLCEKESINMDWLLTGEGKMYKPPSIAEPGAAYSRNVEPCSGGLVQLPVHALAGAGGPKELLEVTTGEHLYIPAEWAKPGTVAVKIRGNSMEPTIMDGGYVGVDKSDKHIESGQMYAVWIDYEGAVIKRLYVEPDRIMLKSDNPEFPTSYIKKENAGENFVIGRVKWVVQRY